MTSEEKKLAGCVGAVLFIPANLTISCAMNGWVFVKLWGWFILPVFPSLPPLSTLSAIGVSLVTGFLTHQILPTPKDEEIGSVIARSVMASLFQPLWILAIGYIIHSIKQ